MWFVTHRNVAGWLGALAVGAGLPPAAPAQELAAACRAAAQAKPGSWASYRITDARAETTSVRFAVVGTERSGDTTLDWFEIASHSSDPRHDGVFQMLIPDGPGTGATAVRGMIVKWGNQPAMKLSAQAIALAGQRMAQSNPIFEWIKGCAGATVVGRESVTVPAGTIPTLHVRAASGDEAWVTPDVPFGLVQGRGKDGSLMALTGHGTDARSSITEKPQEIPFLPGMTSRP